MLAFHDESPHEAIMFGPCSGETTGTKMKMRGTCQPFERENDTIHLRMTKVKQPPPPPIQPSPHRHPHPHRCLCPCLGPFLYLLVLGF